MRGRLTSRWPSSSRCARGGCRRCSGSGRASRSSARWSLPGGYLEPGETLEQSIRRHLAEKVDVRELAHLEQLETLQRPGRATRSNGSSRPPTSASCRPTSTRRCPRTRAGTRSRGCPSSRSTTGRSCSRAATGCAPSSRTRTSASRSRRRSSRSPSCARSTSAALGHEVSATNLQRVLAAPRGARADRREARARARGRPPRRLLSLPLAAARDHRPVRGAQTPRLRDARSAGRPYVPGGRGRRKGLWGLSIAVWSFWRPLPSRSWRWRRSRSGDGDTHRLHRVVRVAAEVPGRLERLLVARLVARA